MRTLALLFAFLLVPAAAAQVIQTPEGKAEFIGLKSLTAEELMSRLAEHDKPKKPHLCAATLKQVGLADAAVEWTFQEDKSLVIVVTCVEEAAGIRYNPEAAAEPREFPRSWTPVLEGAKSPGEFQFGIIHYGRLLASPDTPRAQLIEAIKKEAGGQLHCPESAITDGWDAIGSAAAPDDLDLALWTLRNDREATHRAAAACVLLNFADDDRAWHALVHALRDTHGRVSSISEQCLGTLVKYRARRVDWAPAADDVRPILEGTNPFALRDVMKALVVTEASPELAGKLLSRRCTIIADIAVANEKSGRELALSLLRRLSGKPQADAAELRKWLASLPPA
jgi:hypothetical protein